MFTVCKVRSKKLKISIRIKALFQYPSWTSDAEVITFKTVTTSIRRWLIFFYCLIYTDIMNEGVAIVRVKRILDCEKCTVVMLIRLIYQ